MIGSLMTLGMVICSAFLIKKICVGKYRLLKCIIGIIAFCFYFLIWNIFAFVCQPLFVLLSILLPIVVVLILLKDSLLSIKLLVLSIFVGATIFIVFHNDIDGPLTFMRCDRPIDTPSHWFRCWRFFWFGNILHLSVWLASLLSLIPIVAYKIWLKDKTRHQRSGEENILNE